MACSAIVIDRYEIDQIIEHDEAGEYRAIIAREVRDLRDMGFGSTISVKVFDNETLAYAWEDKRNGR